MYLRMVRKTTSSVSSTRFAAASHSGNTGVAATGSEGSLRLAVITRDVCETSQAPEEIGWVDVLRQKTRAALGRAFRRTPSPAIIVGGAGKLRWQATLAPRLPVRARCALGPKQTGRSLCATR